MNNSGAWLAILTLWITILIQTHSIRLLRKRIKKLEEQLSTPNNQQKEK